MVEESGLLLINKPAHVTSHDVVARVRRALGRKEVGHAGTLDPMATGLLVLLLGEATKISDYVLTGDKGYRLKVELGYETNTLDTDGEVVRRSDTKVSKEQVRALAEQMTGDFNWPVPAFSAIKKDGQKLYELARANKEVEAPVKAMSFWDLQSFEVTDSSFDGQITCSKGSYIRSWASHLGSALKVGGTLSFLQRVYSEPYSLAQAVDLDKFEQAPAEILRSGSFIPLSATLPQFKSVHVKGKDERLLKNGQVSFDLERRMIPEQKACNLDQVIQYFKAVGPHQELVALLEVKPFHPVRIKRVFKA